MKISNNLSTLQDLKNEIKDVVNLFGGNCSELFTEYAKEIEKVIIERNFGGGEDRVYEMSNGITDIADYALFRSNFEKVIMSNSVTSIGVSSFK